MSRQTQQVTASTKPAASGTTGILQRKCASCGNHTAASGECTDCKKKQSALQRKLTIGASNDPLEQEADRIADQVMTMPANPAVSSAPLRIQRFSRQAAETSGAAPASVERVIASPGSPLASGLRKDMEARFGHDFSQVRVHVGSIAEQSARAVNARAYTVGRDVVFGVGQYSPETRVGRQLLAHELTHTVQQGVGARAASPELAIGSAHDINEHEADFAARVAMNGADVRNRLSLVQPTLQRQPDTSAQAQPKETEKKPEIKITPTTRTIPQSEAETQAPLAPAPTGLPDKSPSATGTGAPSASPKKGPEVEASVEGSAKERTVTTKVEVAIPLKLAGPVLVFGQPLVLGKELKAEVSIGPQQVTSGLWLNQQKVALGISMKALSYELESVKSFLPGLTGFGLGVTGEATIDPAAPFARPELGVKAGLKAEYQIGRTPIYLQGSVGYKVKLPSYGPAKAEPAYDFGFKVVF